MVIRPLLLWPATAGIDQIDLTDVPRRMHGCRFLDSEKLTDARLPGARRLGGAVCTLCEQRRTNADLQRHSHVNVISEAAFDQLAARTRKPGSDARPRFSYYETHFERPPLRVNRADCTQQVFDGWPKSFHPANAPRPGRRPSADHQSCQMFGLLPVASESEQMRTQFIKPRTKRT